MGGMEWIVSIKLVDEKGASTKRRLCCRPDLFLLFVKKAARNSGTASWGGETF